MFSFGNTELGGTFLGRHAVKNSIFMILLNDGFISSCFGRESAVL